MALHTAVNAQVLIGDTIADRPNPATVPTEGTIFHEKTTGNCSVLVISAAGVHLWDQLCAVPGPTGPTGATGLVQWPKYVVSKGDPVAPFATISAAIAAAVAAGHGSANPATVLVHPGTYTENVTLRGGIAVVAFDQSVNLVAGGSTNTTISGNVTCNAGDSGNFVLNGFFVLGTITDAVASTNLFLSNISQTVGAIAGDMVSVNVSGVTLQIENSIFTNNGTGAYIRGGSGTLIVAFDSFFLGTNSQVGIVVGANSFINELFGCLVDGQIVLGANSFLEVNASDCNAVTIPNFSLAAGSSVVVEGGSLSQNSAGVSIFSGSGSYSVNGVPSVNGFQSDTTITQTAPDLLLHSHTRSAPGSGAAFTLNANFDEFVLTPSGAATAALPDTRATLNGQRITIKSANGAFAITVNAAAGDVIDGAGSVTIAAGGPPFHAVQLQSVPALRKWDVVAVV